jgi:DNA helicase II / ATP-dependent DNA helicase PcrA
MMPEIFLGPPGTGKTDRLLKEVDRLLANGIAPNRIGYHSFTNAAADEAVGRATLKFKLTREEFPYFSTLHSLCFRQLGLNKSDVADSRMQEFAATAGIELSKYFSMEEGSSAGFLEGDRILFIDNLARMRMVPLHQQWDEMQITSSQRAEQVSWPRTKQVAEYYARWKKTQHLLDFTDMLLEFYDHGKAPQLEALFVDEAQDLSLAQWRVVEKLAANARYVAIAGDDDQAIYEWAGADVNHFIDLPGNEHVLGQSWRVPPAIQSIALDIIDPVSHRRPKVWAPNVRDGNGSVDFFPGVVQADFSVPASWTSEKDYVLALARNTYIIKKQIIPELRSRGVIFVYKKQPSIRPSVIAAVRHWEALRKGREVSVADVHGIYEHMYTRTSKTNGSVAYGFKGLKDFPDNNEMVTIDLLKKRGGLLVDSVWYEALDKLKTKEGEGTGRHVVDGIDDAQYLRLAMQQGNLRLSLNDETNLDHPRVRLSTIHSAKGAEAQHVVLFREMAWRTDQERKLSQGAENAERRVWYVGVTRAKKRISIVNYNRESAKAWCPWIGPI